MRLEPWIIFGGLMVSFSAHAASFNCAKAATKIEKMICADSSLSKIDEELNAAYKVGLKGPKLLPKGYKQAQRQWIKQRDVCENEACLKLTYKARLQALQAPLIEPVSNPDGELEYGSPEQTAKYLEEANRSNIDEKDEGLFTAVREGDKTAVEKWISMGANINAARKSEVEFVGGGHFVGGDESYSPLHVAASSGNKEVVKLLLTKGAQIESKGERGETPLFNAIRSKNKETIELMLATGANIKAKSFTGTPLSMAVTVGSKEIVELLLERRADINAQGENGETALHSAAEMQGKMGPDMIDLLISKGAEVNARDKDGNTALYKALVLNRKESVEQLIAKGAQVSAKNEHGLTPLLALVKSNFMSWDKMQKVVDFLIIKGADVNAKNDENWSVLHEVSKEGNILVANLLIAKGADINAKDKNARTPLSISVQYGRKEIINLLKARGAKE
jgi:cytohesin